MVRLRRRVRSSSANSTGVDSSRQGGLRAAIPPAATRVGPGCFLSKGRTDRIDRVPLSRLMRSVPAAQLGTINCWHVRESVNSIDPAARGGQASTLTLVTLQSTYRNHIRLEGSNGVDRFPALEIISGVFKVLAGLIVVLGFFSGIRSGDGGALITIWVIAAAQGLGLFALAELIGVFRAIEENTRQAAESAWQTHKAIRSTLASAGASPHAAAPPSARPRKREATASPSWLTSTSTTPQSGWGAIDDIERGIGNR